MIKDGIRVDVATVGVDEVTPPFFAA